MRMVSGDLLFSKDEEDWQGGDDGLCWGKSFASGVVFGATDSWLRDPASWCN